MPTSNLMGGSSEYSYEYDDLYRLTSAEGSFTGSNHEHRYSLEMKYNSVGGILEKVQVHERKGSGDSWQQQKKTTYSQSYEYGDNQPHAPIHIGEQKYSYDKNGNQTGWTHDVSGQRRQIVWDEENRIRAIADNGSVQHYIYDASGTRVLKGKSKGQSIYVNSEYKAGSGNMGNYTVYVNPYLVLRSGGYTKHYYIEGQRIVSKLGSGLDNNGKGQLKAGQDKVNYGKKQADIREGIVKNLKFLGIDEAILTAGNSGKTPPGQLKGGKAGSGTGNTGKDKALEKFQYFYHPDHLGSSSYITDASGEVYQHLEYFAFGETFVEEHSNTHRTPYLFNGKELDEETGLYYYGARYYDARTSIWLATDPLADQFAGWSPYNFVMGNPILYVDPDGRAPFSTHTDEDGNVIAVYDDGDLGVYTHANGTTKKGLDSRHNAMVLKNPTGAGGQKVGETGHWDEFVSPETGETMTTTRIQFGESFDPVISEMSKKAEGMDLREIAANSGPGGDFDIKKDYKNVGRLLNGKYASSRSAGNYLAGYNAQGGTYFGAGISFETFQKLAGALHVEGNLTNVQKADIVINGTSYGPPPAYGEVMYQYRMSKAGWNKAKSIK